MPHVEIPQFEFKLVILGEANCGKTSLITRFTQGYFRQHSPSSHTTQPAPQLSSLYPNFVTKSIPITANNIPTKIQIWDVAGQPSNNKRNNSKTNKQQYTAAKAYYSTSSAILLGYDVTSRSSYNEMRVWLEEVRSSLKLTNSGGGEVVVVIVGLKSDLLHNNNNNNNSNDEGVPEYEVQQLAQALNLLYIPTSSKLDMNVTTLFQRVAVEVLERRRRVELGSAYNGSGYHSSLNGGGASPVSKRDMYSKFYDGTEGGGGMMEELLNNNSMEHMMNGGNPALDGSTPNSPKDGKHKKGKNHRRNRSTTTNHQEDALSTDGGCTGAIMNCGGGMETTTDNEDEKDHSHHGGGGDITMNSENEEIGFDKVEGEDEDEKGNGSFLKMCGSPTWCGKTSDTID